MGAKCCQFQEERGGCSSNEIGGLLGQNVGEEISWLRSVVTKFAVDIQGVVVAGVGLPGLQALAFDSGYHPRTPAGRYLLDLAAGVLIEEFANERCGDPGGLQPSR